MSKSEDKTKRTDRPALAWARTVTLTLAMSLALLVLPGAASASDPFGDLTGSSTGGLGSPTISSDKADYAPGETVILTGENWLPAEHVHITVNDDVGQTWIRESDATADEGGSISDQFQLPDSFIARYAVTATGDASGTAHTTFTDGNVKVFSAAGRDFGFTSTLYASSTNCTGTAGTPDSKTGDLNGATVGVGNTQSVLISANLNANAPNASATFNNWTTPGSPAVQFASGYSATDRTVCVVGFQSGNRDLIGNYVLDATPPQVSSINRANANPTSTTGNVSWTVTFSESVTGVDAADFALVSTGLTGTPAITTVTGSGTTYTATASTGTGNGTLKLNLNDNDTITDAAANKLGGTGTGVAGGGGVGNGSFEGQAYTIDRTAPTIAASAVTLPDNSAYTADTWTNKSVRVTFTCTDTGGSGKATDTATGTTDVTAETTSSGTTVNSSGTCTDNAGNAAAGASFGPIKIDKTAPSLSDLGPTSSPNGAGWYNGDVTNEFKASDSLSGPNTACETGFPTVVTGGRKQSKTTTGEGSAVKVSSDACTDAAGNTAAAIDSAAFKVDKTAPSISDLGPTSSPNGAGWHNGDVTNEFKASDSLSGPNSACDTAFPDVVTGGRKQSKTTTGEGSAVKVSSSACTDAAGNTAAAIDSAAFKIDKTAPSITDLGPTSSPNGAGWYNANVVNEFKASDSLSGVDPACVTAFPTVVTGGRKQSKTTTGEGTAVKVSSDACTDAAGNTAAAIDSAAFKIDKTAPSITDLGPTTSPNANDWYKTDVVNEFKASDSLSGLDSDCLSAYPEVSGDRVQSKTTSGEGTAVKVSSDACSDEAGNNAAAIDSAAFKIDQTKPTITNLGPTTSPNAAGWYNTDVVNEFKASDSLSGPDSDCLTAYPDASGDRVQSKTTTGEGTAVKVSSDACTDDAGNTAAAIDSAAFKIDQTKPTISDLGPTSSPNGAGWYNGDVTNEFKASDSLSGPNTACETAFPDVVTGGRKQSKTTTGEGSAVKVTSSACTDVAGNTAAAIDSAAFKIDKTAPSITDLGPTSSPNGAGWYNADVTNEFKASDSLSGPNTACETAFPTVVTGGRKQSKTTTGEGSAVKVSSSACTDAAGNTAAAIDSAAFKIDKTAPSITDLGPTSSPNANGWYKTDVTNEFKASDSLSGPNTACETAFPTVVAGGRKQSKTTSGEGSAVKVSSSACTDVAGNTANAIDSAAFKIDQTKPTITDLGPTSSPNANNWYKTDVVNKFKASDSLSGPDTDCLTAYPDASGDRVQSKTTSGEGTAVKVSSDACSDKAGNTADAIDSAAFQIDKSNPASNAASPTATNQSPFTVDYTASDQAALSGLSKVELYARTPEVGTGYVLAATDNTPSGSGESFSYTPDAGEGTYRFYTVAYDAAGNVESSPVSYDTVTSVETGTPDDSTIFDQTAPVTTDNADGNWHKTAVTVTLTATDESGGSGVDKTFYKVDGAASFTEGTSVVIGAPADHSNDGPHTIYYYSKDKAGNEELANEATVKIDTVAPSVQYTSAAPGANANGWRNVDITATFTATDSLSGFAGPSSTKTGTATTSGEGSAVTVGSPAFTDLAGNTAAAGTAVSDPFKIDKTKPTLAPVVTPNPVTVGGSATVASNASDALSTVDTESCGPLNTSTVGTKSVTCTATDKAGNTDSKTVSYSVQYGWNGFLQPINDTAHQTGLTQSRFKLGSTIPAKFVLRNAAGQVVQQATNPTFTRTNRLRACDANATPEPGLGDILPDGGASYVWDGNQYHYNWSTKAIKDVGVYRIYANLADGTQRWVDICLW